MAREKPTSFYVDAEARRVSDILRLRKGQSFSMYVAEALDFYNQHLLEEYYGGISAAQLIEQTFPSVSEAA